MSVNKLMVLVALATATWLLPGTAGATTITPLTVEQMTDASDLVVRGIVTEVWVERDARGNLWTKAQVEVTRTLKGDPDVVAIDVDQQGGILQDELQLISGAPRFSVGEEGLFFLEHLGSGRTSVVGWQQGKYTRRIDPDSGDAMAVRFNPPYARPYDHRFIPHPAPEHRIYMADLEAQVLDRVEEGWDGVPIPGADSAKLTRINRVQSEVTK